MIVWLNGPFGAGKTTTARLLAAHDPRLLLVDPELVGQMVHRQLADPTVSDFQQYPSWRRLVPLVLDELARASGRHLLAVQSVLREDWWREIRDTLGDLGHDVVHVALDADHEVLRGRIAADQVESTASVWRLDHLPEHASARAWLASLADLVVDATSRTPAEVAALVADHVAEGLSRPTSPGRARPAGSGSVDAAVRGSRR